jgi:glucosamine kinase
VPYFLGIDGGGTKTTCVVGDESLVLATASAGPSNIVRVGPQQTRESLQRAVRQACAGAGISPEEVVRACVGGSGAARPELATVVRGFLAEILPAPIDVVGDHEIALAAAFDTGPGVIVIAVTGSIAYGRDPQGNTLRAGGWGFAVGDEGSAHWIGRSAVTAVLRAADEDSQSSPLVLALLRVWKVDSILDFARVANAVPPPDFATLFPTVAASHEETARQILENGGRELARIAALVMRSGFFATESIPVAMTGGVFRHSPTVRENFYNELARLDRRAVVRGELIEPVEGALRMARRGARQS